jgi:endonuclease/exonuclease/phosphatase (EEP) superfamily protein YafD
VATALPLVRADEWWIRGFDFPRLQFFIVGAIALVAVLVVWDFRTPWTWLIVAGVTAALMLQGARIAPYTPVASTEVVAAPGGTRDTSLSLLVANVLMKNRESGRLLEVLRDHDPDVILLLEPDEWWEAEMRVLEDSYPHAVKQPLDNEYGMLLYSRFPLLEPEVRYLVRQDVPSIHARVSLRPDLTIELHGVHPEPPFPPEAESSAPRDVELILVAREVRQRGGPAIVAGDLNDVAWSRTTSQFQRISGLLDPRKGRGMFNTFHAKNPLLRWPLDHVFHSEHFLLGEMRRLPAFGSDHFPIYIRLVFQREAAGMQEKPQADAADRETAAERISDD